MLTNCIFIAATFVIYPQIPTFSVFKIASFPILITNKNFYVTILLLVYFCNQFVTPEIRHSTADITAVFVDNQHGIQ